MNKRQESTTVNGDAADQEFTICIPDSGPAVKENVVKEQTLEKSVMKGVTEKGVILLARSKTAFRTRF